MFSERMRWLILVLLFVARTGLGFQFQTLGSVSDRLVADLGLNFTEIGTLVGLFMLPGLFLALPAGFAGRFWSDRVLVGLGLLVMAAGGGLAAMADGFGLIALGRIACGAGFVVSNIFFTKMVVDWFAGRELATAMGALVMSWPFGIAMGQVAHGWLAVVFDWRMAFAAAAVYCLAGALLVVTLYRRPGQGPAEEAPASLRLGHRELILTVMASLVWASFNAGYIVYLSFAPHVLVAGGLGQIEALTIVSLASWVMIFSGVVCGQIADRSGKPDLLLYSGMAAAVGCLVLFPLSDLAIPLSLAFGLVGMAPAGVIMALTGEALSPEKRALGMGLFFSIYFLITAPAPSIAGWLFDESGDPYWPILFAAGLFAMTAACNLGFRLLQSQLPLARAET